MHAAQSQASAPRASQPRASEYSASEPSAAENRGSKAQLRDDIREGARREAASRRSTRAALEAAEERPTLRVVSRPRRRVRAVAVVFGMTFAVMLGVTALEIRLAQHQLEIDRIEQSVEVARDRFTDLRKANASLRSPERLLAEAKAMGMVTGRAKDFSTVSPETATMVVLAAGDMLGADEPPRDPFADHERVKRVNQGDAP